MKDDTLPVPEVVYPKWWLQSKTMLVNLVVGLLAAVTYILDSNELIDIGLGDQATRWFTIALVVLGAVNVALRGATEAPVHLRKPQSGYATRRKINDV